MFSQPVISPNGQLVAYAQNEGGRYRVMVVANRDGKPPPHSCSRGGYKTPDQQVETRLPAGGLARQHPGSRGRDEHGEMSAAPARRRAAAACCAGCARPFGFRAPRRCLLGYDQVLSLSYSPDGKALVFSAVRDGQNDLYLLRAGSRKVEQLTNDLFDDVQPVFPAQWAGPGVQLQPLPRLAGPAPAPPRSRTW